MIWPLIIAGGIVALAFFLLMDVATLPARERPARSAARVGYGRTSVVPTGASSTTDVPGPCARPHEDRSGPRRAPDHPRASVESVTNKLMRAGLQPQGVADGLPRLEGHPRFLGFVGGRSSPAPPAWSPRRPCCSGSSSPSWASCSRRLRHAEDPRAEGSPAGGAAGRARPPRRLGRGRPRLRRRHLEAHRAHGGTARRRVRPRARRDADR